MSNRWLAKLLLAFIALIVSGCGAKQAPPTEVRTKDEKPEKAPAPPTPDPSK